MIRTKFATSDIFDWITMMLEFEDKLTLWCSENTNATYDMEVFVGEGEYYLIITVDSDETDNHTDKLEL
tara:strand:+ start:1270 stop:1476 length:207 start_codon:yes stop_codon:yes gene_type:complete